MKVITKTWDDFYSNVANEEAFVVSPLARFLAVRDCYANHIKPFRRFLEDNRLDLDLAEFSLRMHLQRIDDQIAALL